MNTDGDIWLDKATLQSLPGYNPFAEADGFCFDERKARRAITFFHQHLSFVKGDKTNQRFYLERWQQAFIANLFGWCDENGYRRYRRFFFYIPRKNGKTPLASGIVLYGTGVDDEGGAEVYSGASTRQQASRLFDWAAKQVRADPTLRSKFRVKESVKEIHHDTSGSCYTALSREAGSAHGGNTHFAIIDELHVIEDRDFLEAIETSLGARTQPILGYLTTADYDRESLCNDEYEYACKVRDGVIKDPSYLPVIYEAPPSVVEDGTWADEAVWEACNPNLDVSVSREFLRSEAQKAALSENRKTSFCRLYLNVKVGTANAVVPIEDWRKCGSDERATPGDNPVYAAIDVSSNQDLTAVCWTWERDGFPYFRWRCWLPDHDLQSREQRDRATYWEWYRNGYLELSNGPVIDQEVILQAIRDLNHAYNLQGVVVDPWNAQKLMTTLQDESIHVEEYPQTYKYLSGPTKAIQAYVALHNLDHGGNELVQWTVSNVVLQEDPHQNIKPVKKKSTGRIDPFVAMVMSEGKRSGIFSENVETVPSNPYADRGVPAL